MVGTQAASMPWQPLRNLVLGGAMPPATFSSGSTAAALGTWFGAAAPVLHQGFEALREALDRDVAVLDAMIHQQLESVLQHPEMRRIEGSWRGLHGLVARLPGSSQVRLRMLSVSWTELCRDFERASGFDRSDLFQLVYEQEFGHAGGEPFGLLCADFDVVALPARDRRTDDVAALVHLAGIAAAAFAPTVLAAHPAILGLDGFEDLGAALDLAEALRSPAHRRWQRLQEQEDSRFLAVLLPRALARAPWADDGIRADRFRPGGRLGPRLWTSPVYAFAATTLRAFQRHGWPADIRGALLAEEPSGGVVEGLPVEHFAGDPAGPPPRPPVEVALADLQERQIAEAGLLPLLALEGLPEGSFAAAPSLHRPPRMTTETANANQRLSAQFNAVLCVSRFAHCIKIMGREMVGASRTATEIQLHLQRWLSGFVNESGGGNGPLAARFPLRTARVEVRALAGRPGSFGCVIHLQPHYQLDEVGAAFRLVTDLSTQRRAA
jgi:type VI secretion system protein ImpD/type VI secretion system protein ImpC